MQADQHIKGQAEGQDEGQGKESAGRIAVIVGVTGLIGSHLLKRLLQSNHYSKVVAIARSSAADSVKEYIDGGQLIWQPFSEPMPDQVDHFFCALGTTQKVAGKAGLAAVDRDLVVETASAAIAKAPVFVQSSVRLEQMPVRFSFTTGSKVKWKRRSAS